MKYMNDYDIHTAKQRNWDNPVVMQAIRFLEALIEETNAHSDGWVYWKAPVHAAQKLMLFIEDIENNEIKSEARYRKALTPIKSFYTRKGNAAGMKFPEVKS